MTGKEQVVVEPPTLNERLDWTYEQLLALRVSMLHLAKQLPGKAAQIETWGRQLNDMVGEVAKTQAGLVYLESEMKEVAERQKTRGEGERRVCVQGHGRHHLREDDSRRAADAKPPGTITWGEHERAWQVYERKYGPGQSAERIVERGGFGYQELVEFLGRDPETWEAKK